MKMLSRAALLRLSPLVFLVPPPAYSSDEGLSTLVRKAVVRGAQIADKADSVWQQVAGEVVPAWQQPSALPRLAVPPAYLDGGFARDLLALPLDIGARVAGIPLADLEAQLPAARREAVLLYADGGTGQSPLFNEPFYRPAEPSAAKGTAVRGFPREFAEAAAERASLDLANSTIFNYEAYVRWRLLQTALSGPERAPDQRRVLQRAFSERLGAAMLTGPLRSVALPPAPPMGLPRSQRSLRPALAGCGALLEYMQKQGLFSSYTLQLGLGSGTESYDEDDWRAGGSTSWQYVISGSAIVGGSQLAQDRTAATGLGAGYYPGQLLTAPLAAYLSQLGIRARIDEYFLDNRVGRPDPRTFSDPRYYSETLLDIVALEES